jgi:hypothetical protein
MAAKGSTSREKQKIIAAVVLFVAAGGIYFFLTRDGRAPAGPPGPPEVLGSGGGSDAGATSAPIGEASRAGVEEEPPYEEEFRPHTTGTRAINPEAPPPEMDPENEPEPEPEPAPGR